MTHRTGISLYPGGGHAHCTCGWRGERRNTLAGSLYLRRAVVSDELDHLRRCR